MTKAEKRALWVPLVIAVGFLPPVTWWTGKSTPLIFGVPLNFLWTALMVALTSLLLWFAYRAVAAEGFPDEEGGGDA